MPEEPTRAQAVVNLCEIAIRQTSDIQALRAAVLALPIPTRGQAMFDAMATLGQMVQKALNGELQAEARALATPVAIVGDVMGDPAAGLPTMNCRSCGQLMIMVPHWKSGQASPLQADPTGEIVIESGRWKTVGKAGAGDDRPRYTTHFATCPEAKKWANRNRRNT